MWHASRNLSLSNAIHWKMKCDLSWRLLIIRGGAGFGSRIDLGTWREIGPSPPSGRHCNAAGSSFSAGDFIRRASAAEQEWPFERDSLRLALQDVRTRQAAPLLIISVCSHSLLLYQRSTLERISGSMVGAGRKAIGHLRLVRIMNEGDKTCRCLGEAGSCVFCLWICQFNPVQREIHPSCRWQEACRSLPLSLHAICGLRLATLGFTPSTPKVDLNGRQTSDDHDRPSWKWAQIMS